jgi:hypothetical protein
VKFEIFDAVVVKIDVIDVVVKGFAVAFVNAVVFFGCLLRRKATGKKAKSFPKLMENVYLEIKDRR